MIGVIVTLFFASFASAQAPPPPAAPVPPAESAPAPAAPENQPPPAPVTPPPADVPAQTPPPNNPAPPPGGDAAPPPAASAPVPEAPAPAPQVLAPVGNGPALPSLATPAAKKATYKEIEANASLRNKSPFMIPTELYLRIKRRQGEKVVESVIDDNVSPKLRWPIRSYTLIGVLTGVKIPKALIKDKNGKIHTFRNKEFIANSGGYISEIGNGEVIVVERGAEFKLSLKGDLSN